MEWFPALQLQRERVMATAQASATPGPNAALMARLQTDYSFFLYALSQFLRAARFTADVVDGGEALDAAIEQFNDRQPHVKLLRDAMIEHWDDYQLGVGRVAHRQLGVHSPIGFASADDGSGPRITSVGGGALDGRVDVIRATDDAGVLFEAICDFLAPLTGMPMPLTS